jgi:hypothetical protein
MSLKSLSKLFPDRNAHFVPWAVIEQPVSALGGACHVRKKHAEATKQQSGADHQWKLWHQGGKNAS